MRNINSEDACFPVEQASMSSMDGIDTIICIGDSITAGWMIGEENSYPAVLKRFFRNTKTVINEGYSGGCTIRRGNRPYIYLKEFEDALKQKGDVYIIMLGTNDAQARNVSYLEADFKRDYVGIINAVRDANPKAKIYLNTIIPVTREYDTSNEGNILSVQVRKVVAMIKEIASETGCILIDVNKGILDLPDYRDFYTVNFNDGVHPNADGAAAIAKIVYNALITDK